METVKTGHLDGWLVNGLWGCCFRIWICCALHDCQLSWVSKCNFLHKDRHLIIKMVMSAIFNNPSIKYFSKQNQILLVQGIDALTITRGSLVSFRPYCLVEMTVFSAFYFILYLFVLLQWFLFLPFFYYTLHNYLYYYYFLTSYGGVTFLVRA